MAERTCTIDGCAKAHRAKGLCAAHYSKAQRASIDDDSPRCSVSRCKKPVFTKASGMCQMHLTRVKRHGSVDANHNLPARDLSARFWSKVEQRGECWEWVGHIKWSGYGSFHSGKRHGTFIAHRFAYEDMIGPIPDGLELDHLCRNRPCVNPYHLEPVTRAVNHARMIAARASLSITP